MMDPVRLAGQAAVRLQINEGAGPDRAAIDAMLAKARDAFGAGAALGRFEFRLKESGGQRYLELREQTRFGAFREAIGSRSEARNRERQDALALLGQAYGKDILAQVGLDLGQSPASRVQARQAVAGTQELARRTEHLLNQLREAGFDSLDKARSFVESKCNFAASLDQSYENSINQYAASALPLAVYERPELLDPEMSMEQRASILADYEKQHLEKQIADLRNAPRGAIDSLQEHLDGVEQAVQGAYAGAEHSHKFDMEYLANPADTAKMRHLFVRGKEMGLRLDDVVGLGRTNNVRSGQYQSSQLQSLLERAFASEPISANELKLLEGFFRLGR
jgi:hypothetical protein